MNGIIAINAYAPDNTRQVRRMKEELAKRGVTTNVVNNDMPHAYVSDGNIIASSKYACDFCLYLDKDKYAAAMLEKTGVRLFNTAAAIEKCDDKMTTHIILSNDGIKMPKTVAGLLCYDNSLPVKTEYVKRAGELLHYPVIVKLAFGSMGKGVFMAKTEKELIGLLNAHKTEPMLLQEYIKSSHGVDMRVIVTGGRVLGGILRRSDNGDFRSNIGLGGSAQKTEVPAAVRKTAVRAAEILGLDYCGIDFLLADEPLLCEVNSNAFFDAFEQATGINVAGAYAEHIINAMQNRSAAPVN